MWGGRLTTLRLSHTATRPSSLRFCKIPRLVVPVLVARQHLCGRRRPPAPLQHVHLCAHRRVVAQLDQRVARHPRLLERALVRVSVAAPNGSVVFSAGPVPSPPFGAVLFPAVPFSPGTLTAEGLVADGTTVLASDAARSWGAPAALVLSLDAPSLATGTGDGALLLDGGDVALVRATVVDAAGNPCGDATDNITFAVSSPGASESPQRGFCWVPSADPRPSPPALPVIGVGNGDPSDQSPNAGPWRGAYHGLARAIVKAALAALGSADYRATLAALSPDAGGSQTSARVWLGVGPPPASMTISASAPGLQPASLNVSLSLDPADGVLAVAARSVGAADTGA